ncbi:hypothetical protein [Saccharopolyspora taberi]|uniref:ANTAR domain-containing protein n=1 Tax=Saccharopolyspora taberi TaxID=60895 RepID=A0ABN3VHQ9_9PSEU
MPAASMLVRAVAREQAEFDRDAREAADLAARIVKRPTASLVSGDLSRLSHAVAELVRRHTRIQASTEAVTLMAAEPTTDRTTQ